MPTPGPSVANGQNPSVRWPAGEGAVPTSALLQTLCREVGLRDAEQRGVGTRSQDGRQGPWASALRVSTLHSPCSESRRNPEQPAGSVLSRTHGDSRLWACSLLSPLPGAEGRRRKTAADANQGNSTQSLGNRLPVGGTGRVGCVGSLCLSWLMSCSSTWRGLSPVHSPHILPADPAPRGWAPGGQLVCWSPELLSTRRMEILRSQTLLNGLHGYISDSK